MDKIHTSPELLARMRAASQILPSERDLHDQKISFISGAMSADNDITKEQIEVILARHEGRTVRR